MKRRRNRLNLNPKSPTEALPRTLADNFLSPSDAKKQMKEDWAAGIRRIDAFRENMALCRILRKEEAKKLPGLLLLRQYPALGLSELVSSFSLVVLGNFAI